MLLVVRRENFVTVFDPNPPVGQSNQEDFNRQDDQTVLIRLPVASEDRGKSEGEDCHQLDQDVQGRTRGVLERIADGVANNASFVSVGLFAAIHLFVFDVLLAVVPGATGVRHHDGQHKARSDGSRQQTTEALGANQQTDGDRREDSDDTRQEHFVDGGFGARFDTCHVVAHNAFLTFQQARDSAELALDFNNDRTRGFSDGQHRQSGE